MDRVSVNALIIITEQTKNTSVALIIIFLVLLTSCSKEKQENMLIHRLSNDSVNASS